MSEQEINPDLFDEEFDFDDLDFDELDEDEFDDLEDALLEEDTEE